MTPTRMAWKAMKRRCTDKGQDAYPFYGGRGITYCSRWELYGNFLEDMGEKPEGTSLDRINNDGNYTPDNCRWAEREVQAYNKRTYSSNKTGIKGVAWHERDRRWIVRISVNNKKILLYGGPDFFEACCARKSWEAKRARAWGIN